jgi:hypothetical protein
MWKISDLDFSLGQLPAWILLIVIDRGKQQFVVNLNLFLLCCKHYSGLRVVTSIACSTNKSRLIASSCNCLRSSLWLLVRVWRDNGLSLQLELIRTTWRHQQLLLTRSVLLILEEIRSVAQDGKGKHPSLLASATIHWKNTVSPILRQVSLPVMHSCILFWPKVRKEATSLSNSSST